MIGTAIGVGISPQIGLDRLGPELITNGDFLTDSDWSDIAANGMIQIAAGEAKLTRTVGEAVAQSDENITLPAGDYELSQTIVANVSLRQLGLYVSGTQVSARVDSVSGVTVTVASPLTGRLQLRVRGGVGVIVVDSISLRQIL